MKEKKEKKERENNIIQRLGNKESDIKFFIKYLPLDCKNIIEPFAGSFAVIRKVYNDYTKYNLFINDLDEDLYFIYTHIDEYIKEKNDLMELYKNNLDSYINTLEFPKKSTEFKNDILKSDINEIIKNQLINTFFIKGCMFKPIKSRLHNKIEYNILKNATITNDDYIECIEKFKDDENAFIFLDPPYLFSNNSSYIPCKDTKHDTTFILIVLLDYFKRCKCKLMLVINKLDIISYLFKDYIKDEYEKVYQITKKKMTHLIITNY